MVMELLTVMTVVQKNRDFCVDVVCWQRRDREGRPTLAAQFRLHCAGAQHGWRRARPGLRLQNRPRTCAGFVARRAPCKPQTRNLMVPAHGTFKRLLALDFSAWNDRRNRRHWAIGGAVFGLGRILLGFLCHFLAALVTFCHKSSISQPRHGA